MQNLLVITALGQDRPGIVKDLTKAILDQQCNVTESRMSILGGEFAVIMLVKGDWNQLAKLESKLEQTASELDLTLIVRQTEALKSEKPCVPYTVEVVSIDEPGIVHKISQFFSSHSINIQDLATKSYSAAHTGTPMFAMSMTINIPSDVQLAALRDDFFDYCDEQNVDAVFEPARN